MNYGGIISRTIKNLPDERHYNDLIPLDTEIQNDQNLTKYCVGCSYASLLADYSSSITDCDKEYDIFSYTLPSQSGHFIFKRGTTIDVLNNPVLLPYHPLKIIPTLSGTTKNNYNFSYFDVFDETGNQYRFGKSLKDGYEPFENYDYLSSPTTAQNGKSAWLLTEMISADKADTIHFEYEDVLAPDPVIPGSYTRWITKSHISFQNSYSDYIGGGAPDINHNDNWNYTASTSAYRYTTMRIKKITFKNNYIIFQYRDNIYPNSLLNNITIYNYKSDIVKSMQFSQTQFHSDASRLNWFKLDDISFYGSDLKKLNSYSFEYETLMPFPINKGNKETYSIDHWGYYNGASNTNPIPANAPSAFSSVISGTADRTPYISYTQTGVLKRITLPEGGTVSFSYESNAINSKTIGGIRIAQMSITSGNDQIIKTYQYNSASGIFEILPIYYLSRSGRRDPFEGVAPGPTWNTETYSSDLNCDITVDGRPVVYTNVIEYIGDKLSFTSKIQHEYDASSVFSYGLIPIFPQQTAVDNTGYSNLNYGVLSPTDYYQSHIKYGNINENKTTYYNATNQVVKCVSKYYSNLIKDSYNGLRVRRLYTDFSYWTNCSYHYVYSSSYLDQLAQTLDSIVTKDYYNQVSITQKESYVYNDRLFPVSQLELKSDGTTIKKTFTYPTDDQTILNCSTMVANNIIAPVVTTKEYKKDGSTETLLQTINTDYNEFGKPLVVKTASYSNTLEDRIYYSYNPTSQNLQSVNKANDISTSYLWGYNKLYPIAKIDNATYSQVTSALGVDPETIAASTTPDMTKVDGLRTSLPTAKVTTYTYKPLVGVSSVTDPRGIKTSYYYDNFNRLFLVRDNQGNIISQNSYNYQNSTSSNSDSYSAGKIITGTAYSFGAAGTATINTSNLVTKVGASGDYSYNWYLKRPNGSIISSVLNSMINSFSFVCSDAGELTIQSDVKDNKFGNTYSASCITHVSEGSFIVNSNFHSNGV